MFWNVAKFEFNYQIRQPLFIITFMIFFLLVFFAVISDNVSIGDSANENVNSPFAIMNNLLVMSIFGMFIIVAFLSTIVLRDDQHKMSGIIYSTRITKKDYLLGRFIGAFAVAVIAFSSTAFAMIVGSLTPWVDAEELGRFSFYHYVFTMAVIVVPNLFFPGTIFLLVATLTRSLMLTYAAVVAFFALYIISFVALQGPDYLTLAGIIDPYGFSALQEATRYWTTFDRNSLLMPLEGIFLYNRLLWTGLGLVMIGITVAVFRFETVSRKKAKKGKASEIVEDDLAISRSPKAPWRPRQPVFTAASAWQQFRARAYLEGNMVVKSVPFAVIMAIAFFNTLLALLFRGQFFGTDLFPVTRMMLTFISGSFNFFILILVIYYTAELVWRERTLKVQEIVDAAPAPNWVFVFSKLTAMLTLVASLMLVSMITAVGVQLGQGYTEIEIGLYLRRILLHMAIPFYLISVLSIFVHVLVNNKYLGMLIMVVYLISSQVLSSLGFEHNLYQFAGRPNAPLSDMNGYGHFTQIALWFDIYWTSFSILLAVGAYALWNRGTLQGLRSRIRLAPEAFGPVTIALFAVGLVGFLGMGGFIYYNTNVLNQYVTQEEQDQLAVDYELAYRQYEGMPQPRVIDVKTDVAIYPYQRRYTVEGRYIIENRTDAPLETVHVGFDANTDIESVALAGAELASSDEKFNYYIYTLDPPMQPGEQRQLDFSTYREEKGFRNSGNVTTINFNGTFFNNTEAMPSLGFNRRGILIDRKKRRSFDLEPADRAAKLEDMEARRNSYLSTDSDWVKFETVVSTTPGQVAMAPGYLEREWVEDGRRYFHYKMDAPIQNFFAYLSAEYTRAKDSWNDVEIEILYHAPHAYNVDRMTHSVKKSLDYFSANFSPYQYRQMRILEFPAYADFAQSFPNTVPYSEGIGFIADLSDEEKIDYVFYVTAHEVAHQWWAHQVMGANTQGGQVLVETLAQYSALMVMEKEFGPHIMRRFLKYELDNYLTNRGGELIEELPLYRVENQDYIHYQKGSLVMYAMKDYLGEEAVNRVLAKLIRETAYQYDPYPTSLDLVDRLREEATEDWQQELITDLFERIVLFDLKVDEATVTERADGLFDVTMIVQAQKFEADGEGKEEDSPLDMLVDFGIFSGDPTKVTRGQDHVIHFEKKRIVSGKNTFTFTVDKRPERVGVDPYNKLIDRNSDDNLKSVDSVIS